jgi:putative cell wall-binding protein
MRKIWAAFTVFTALAATAMGTAAQATTGSSGPPAGHDSVTLGRAEAIIESIVAARFGPASGEVRTAATTAENTADTLTGPNNPSDGFQMEQVTRGDDPNTVTFSIEDYQPITVSADQFGAFSIAIDSNLDGVIDDEVTAAVIPSPSGSSTPQVAAVIGPNTPHAELVTASLTNPNTLSLSFPRSIIGGTTTFGWAAVSIYATFNPSDPTATPAGGIDSLPANLGLTAPVVSRVAGSDRIATSVAASFITQGAAKGVVLARDDDYPDALGGAALAADVGGPLLLTTPASLDPRVLAEIQRVLPAGGTVYLLGGTDALSTAVESAVRAAGYQTQRLSGANRFATSLAVVSALGNPGTILLTTGDNYPDALSAGAAAAAANWQPSSSPTAQLSSVPTSTTSPSSTSSSSSSTSTTSTSSPTSTTAVTVPSSPPSLSQAADGVLLTDGSTLPPAVAAYLQAHPADKVYAVGGPAAAADPGAIPLVGADRYATAVKVATALFDQPDAVGLATGAGFADALAAAASMGVVDGPLLLTSPASLPAETQQYLSAQSAAGTVHRAFLFGGTGAVSTAVLTQATQAITPALTPSS